VRIGDPSGGLELMSRDRRARGREEEEDVKMILRKNTDNKPKC